MTDEDRQAYVAAGLHARLSDTDRAAIQAAVDAFDVTEWAPLTDAERDLVSRALIPPQRETEQDSL